MKLAIAAVVSVSMLSSQAMAGNISDPVVESAVIAEDSNASSAGIVFPLILLAVLIGAAAGSSGGGAAPVAAASDAKLKADIAPVGATAHGLTLYQFRYLGQTQVYEGVMAQDVLAIRPDAITTDSAGYMAVDYRALGLEMTAVK